MEKGQLQITDEGWKPPPPPRGRDAGGGDEVSEVIYHLEAEFSHTVYCNADNSGSM